MSRFVRPETVKLDLSEGDWLIVKRRLTTGEERRAFTRSVKPAEVGKRLEVNVDAVAVAKVTAYLLDWSLVDDTGQVVPVRDASTADVEAALDALDPASFREIHDAITAHEARQLEALANEKKTRSTASGSSATSISAA